MNRPVDFWDALAPHHAALENSYLDLPSLRRIIHRIKSPVLVVGAGQGLIVAELCKRGFQCDGVDLSSEMIRHAKLRRRLDLVQADARALPFVNEAYETIIYATGVIDFMSDEDAIRALLVEGRRVVTRSGMIFVAFCRFSPATVEFLTWLGLLQNHVFRHRETLEIYKLKQRQAIAWVANRAKVGSFRAAMLSLIAWARSNWQEKRNALHLQKVFTDATHAQSLLQTAPEQLPYRNEAEIRNLFCRLLIPVKRLDTTKSCYLAEI